MEQETEGTWTKRRPFCGRVIRRWNLCNVFNDDDKTTMHIDIDIEKSGLAYLPGDAVGIYPQNRPKARHKMKESQTKRI